jgi:hypothetical protein
VVCNAGFAGTWSWTNAGSGDYMVAGNWSGGVTPSGYDVANIDNGGTAVITGADAVTNQFIMLGNAVGGPMNTLNISGGTFVAPNYGAIYVGNYSGGSAKGTVNQSGGSVGSRSNYFSVRLAGNSSSNQGYYNLSGGTLTIGSGQFVQVGYTGTGVFTQTGGTLKLSGGSSYIGIGNRNAGSNGTYRYMAGSIAQGLPTDNASLTVGLVGATNTGTFRGNGVVALTGSLTNNGQIIAEGYTAASIAGVVNLQNYVGDVTTVPVTIEIQNTAGNSVIETHTVNLDSAGRYSFTLTSALSSGNYIAAAKASHWLAQDMPFTITSSSSVSDSLLDLSSFGSVGSSVTSAANGYGWYAQSAGSLKLPPISVAAGSNTYNWGEDPSHTSINLVNSAQFTFHNVTTAGTFSGTLLASDCSSVPIPSPIPPAGVYRIPATKVLGIWNFVSGNLIFDSFDLTIRYDSLAAGSDEPNLKIMRFDNGYWVNVGGTIDTTKHTISITGFSALGYYAVCLPDPVQDVRQCPRMADYNFANIDATDYSDASAAAQAAQAYQGLGFNIILGEYDRYLFNDSPNPVPELPADLLTSGTFDVIKARTWIMTNECHKNGLRLFWHGTSTRAASQLLTANPSWALVDLLTLQPVLDSLDVYYTCISNDTFMTNFIGDDGSANHNDVLYNGEVRLKGIMEGRDPVHGTLPPDGIMVDEINFNTGTDVCACPSCRSKFTAATGYQIPDPSYISSDGWIWNLTEPSRMAHLRWRRQEVEQRMARIYSLLQYIDPSATMSTYLCDNSQNYTYVSAGEAINDFPQMCNSVGYECMPPATDDNFYDVDNYYYTPLVIPEMKYLRAVAEDMNIAPWTHFYDQNNSDYYWTWFQAMCQASSLWTSYTNSPYGSGPWASIEPWEAAHDGLRRNLRSAANIGILFSLDSRDRNPNNNGNRTWVQGFIGACNAMTDWHIPYKVVVDEDLVDINGNVQDLTKKVHTLILPNNYSMSAEACAAVRNFVSNGGTLIATGQTSLYDENGNIQSNFGLADVFGCNYTGNISATTGMFTILSANTVIPGFSGINQPLSYSFAQVTLNGGSRQGTILCNGTSYPGMIQHNYGSGKSVYFACNPAYNYLYSYYSEPTIVPGQPWTDPRNSWYGTLIEKVAQYNNTSIPYTITNAPAGVVSEAYKHEGGGTQGIQVHIGNFTGANLTTTSFVPSIPSIYGYPSLSSAIGVTVRDSTVRSVWLYHFKVDGSGNLTASSTPDQLSPTYNSDGTVTATVDMSTNSAYAIIYFSHGTSYPH